MFVTRIVVRVLHFHYLCHQSNPPPHPFLLTVLVFNSFCKVEALRPHAYSYLHHRHCHQYCIIGEVINRITLCQFCT